MSDEYEYISAFGASEPVLYGSIVTCLSALIRKVSIQLEAERNFPSANPDKMDDRLKHFQGTLDSLIALRAEFEITMTRATP